ncbi:hypothetical protein [Novosphingobium pentaromativorans]|uniref:NIPSNAP domain-containing protein n=1 Tax=Novosphingobium pentaromativorans US6-1 TaxID=1088721 RepID=G6EAW3_9SPHN|nr:hypothetical protein [Novosphingobium pentaromativorans]EHJ61750.1 hypothetical protein NSU_1511 [Novosphingobium pentaromativorans US6-1]
MDGPIFITDTLCVEGARAEEVRDRYLDDYAPTAQARGMTLESTTLCPPVLLDKGTNALIFEWSVPDLAGWWRMRLGGAGDERVTQFWSGIAPLIVDRSRTLRVPFEGGQQGNV